MVVCDPKSLLAASRCLPCLTPTQQRQAKASLFCKVANVGIKGGGGPTLPLVTNFLFIPRSANAVLTQAIGSWDPPPAPATATELWTSTDNITYTRAGIIAGPGTNLAVNVGAVGSFTWAKARWTDGQITPVAVGPFTTPQEVSNRVCDWARRCIVNGALATTVTERTAMNTFDLALVSAGIDGNMVYNLTFVSSSLAAAFTPLYKVAGNDPATNNGPFVAGDLTVNGLMGDGVAKFLQIGITPNVTWPFNGAVDNGLTAYRVTAGNGAGLEIGAANANNNNWIQVDNAGGNTTFASYGITLLTDWLVQGNALFTGFVSGQRGSLARADIYVANSTTPFASIANTTNGIGQHGTNCNVPLLVFALNSGGAAANFLGQRLSYVSCENALSTAQCQSYFNAVQALRVGLGGGFV